MNKQERDQIYGMCEFIHNLYSYTNLEVPENFNPEEQAIIISNALKHKGRIEMANCLLLSEKNEEEKKKLKFLIESSMYGQVEEWEI